MTDPRTADRLAALRTTDLLDSPPEEAFDRYTRTLARVLGVTTAMVTLVDDRRQFVKSQVGLAEPWAQRRETPLSHSFCRFAVESDAPFVVGDARTDARVQGSPAVEELEAVAYAGVPLHAPDGTPIGALCALSSSPRRWSADDLLVVQELAEAVNELIAVRAAAERRRAAVLALSHQLRSSLTGLLLEADDLVGLVPAGEAREAAQRVRAGLAGLATAVEEAAAAAEQRLAGQSLDVALAGVAARAAAAGRAVVVPAAGLSVAVPPGELVRLVDDAVRVLLDAGRDPVRVVCTREGALVRVRVQDSGGAVPAALAAVLTARSDHEGDDASVSLAERAARSGGRLVVGSGAPATLDLLLPADD